MHCSVDNNIFFKRKSDDQVDWVLLILLTQMPSQFGEKKCQNKYEKSKRTENPTFDGPRKKWGKKSYIDNVSSIKGTCKSTHPRIIPFCTQTIVKNGRRNGSVGHGR